MKKAYKVIFLFTLLTFNFINSYGNYDFNLQCKQAYSEILNLRFNKAQKILESEKVLNPANDIPYFLDNYIDLLTIVIGDNISDYNKLKPNKSSRLDRLERGDTKSPYYRYCLAEVYIQWAFAHVKNKEYISAVYNFTKAYRLLDKNKSEFPLFIQNKKDLGLLHIFIGALPDDYRGVTKVLNMQGDLKEGTAELEEVIKYTLVNPEFSYLKTESTFLLTFVYISFWHDRNKLKELDDLYSGIINNDKVLSPLITYALAKLAVAEGNNDKAIDLLISKPEGHEYFNFSYLDYFTGLTKLDRLDDDADKYLLKFIKTNNGSSYLKTAEQKLAWCYLLRGECNRYYEHISQIKLKGDNSIDEDIQAEREADNNEAPNEFLLRGRLLCDGGYYEKCISVISNKKAADSYKTTGEYLEFSYRLGRAYHEWGKTEQAIPYYELTIKDGSESEYYFAANSSLNLGYIYEKQHKYDRAKYYYNKCLSLKNTEYKNSIRQKAKSGLRRLQ